MTDILLQAKQQLLTPAELDENHLQQILHGMLSHQVDAADLYFQSVRHEGWVLEDGIVKEGSYNADRGVGVRAVSGEKTGFAYANDIAFNALEAAANASRSIARAGQDHQVQAWNRTQPLALYNDANPLDSLSRDDKVKLLKEMDAEARRLDSRIKQVSVSLSGVHEYVLIAAADGTLSADVRPLVRLNISVIVEDKGHRERGSFGGGGRGDYHMFFNNNTWKKYTAPNSH